VGTIGESQTVERAHRCVARRRNAVELRGKLDVFERRERRVQHALVGDESHHGTRRCTAGQDNA
jgi:hypothetical protein